MTKVANFESTTGAFVLDWTDDGIGVLTFDVPGKSVNAFSRDILNDFENAVDVLEKQSGLNGLVIKSGKPGSFAAGVDISIFETLQSADGGYQAASQLQELFGRIESLPATVVVAIEGVCLGGGMELSLACHYRVLSDTPETKMGLPEVQLGLLPGGGGTQRLPRLIGLTQALPLMLTGKQVDAKKALKLGIADAVVPPNQLLDQALHFCRTQKPRTAENRQPKMDVNKLALEGNAMGRALIKKKSLEQIEKNTKGHYPAPKKILESAVEGFGKSLRAGLTSEAKLFGELVSSRESRSLVHIFEIMTAAKKNRASEDAVAAAKKDFITPLKSGSRPVGILGAGLMGSGIATVLAQKNIRSVLYDKSSEGISRGLQGVAQHFDDRVRKRRMRRFEAQSAVSKVCPSLDFQALKSAHVVIEAVFEDLNVKHEILKSCEETCGKDLIFASNTSSIPISRIAEGARDPSRVVGMHFFSPVPKMPLVEIIKTSKTDESVVAATFELAAKMGKNIIVVNDGPGFYTTRILAFFIAEALSILSEGGAIDEIDRALETFGMPVGPVTLLDEVGIDVGKHIIEVLQEAFSDRLVVPPEVHPIAEENRMGRKNEFGFYTYSQGKKAAPDATIYRHFKHGQDRIRMDRKDIVDRCVFAFLNEAARCLDEGIIASADDGDLGAVFGLGFPPFLGGPFHYAKTLGYDQVRRELDRLAEKFGERFVPAAHWSQASAEVS